jgi:hypothetical protein
MLILLTILFILLSPGMIVTLPPGSRGLFASEETSNLSVLVHAVAFFVILNCIANDYFMLGFLGSLESKIINTNNNVKLT